MAPLQNDVHIFSVPDSERKLTTCYLMQQKLRDKGIEYKHFNYWYLKYKMKLKCKQSVTSVIWNYTPCKKNE